MLITVMLKKRMIREVLEKDTVHPWDTMALCPIDGCGGIDNCYMVDDLTHHRCDRCGSRWSTYDPYNSIEECFNIKPPKSRLTDGVADDQEDRS